MQPFEVPEISTRFDVFNFIQTSNNLVTTHSVLFDLLVNLEQGQELAQLELDLEFLELSRSSNKGDSSTNNIKQKIADIEALKAKNFKHNNIETIETIKLIKDVLVAVDLLAQNKGLKGYKQFLEIKTDTFLGCRLQQEITNLINSNGKPSKTYDKFNLIQLANPNKTFESLDAMVSEGDTELFLRDDLVVYPYAITPQRIIDKCQYLKQYQSINQED